MLTGSYKSMEDCSSMASYYDQFGPNTIIRVLENNGYDKQTEEAQYMLKEWFEFEDGSTLTIINRYETFVDG